MSETRQPLTLTLNLSKTRINSAALTDTNGNSMNLNDVAGGFTRNVAGNVTGAAAMKFMFWLRNDRWELQSGKDKGKQEDLKADAWEEQFLEIGQAAHSGFRIERLATRSFGDTFYDTCFFTPLFFMIMFF